MDLLDYIWIENFAEIHGSTETIKNQDHAFQRSLVYFVTAFLLQ